MSQIFYLDLSFYFMPIIRKHLKKNCKHNFQKRINQELVSK